MVTCLTGANSFLLRTELNKLVAAFVVEQGDMALEKIDGEESSYDRIREALESMPFLASKKLVVLRAPSANKDFLEKAETLLSNLSGTTDVIVYEPKLDKRTSYAKYLQKETDYREFKELDGPGLARWLTEETKKAGNSISASDANHLIKKLGPNQQLLASELNKLLNTGQPIDRNIINELIEPVPQSSIFDLIEAAFSGRKSDMLALYEEQRRQNVEPQQIIALLAWQLHILAVCVWAGDKPASEIAHKARLNPYVVQKSLHLARGLTKKQMRNYINKLLALDEAAKTSAVHTDDALQAYLLAL